MHTSASAYKNNAPPAPPRTPLLLTRLAQLWFATRFPALACGGTLCRACAPPDEGDRLSHARGWMRGWLPVPPPTPTCRSWRQPARAWLSTASASTTCARSGGRRRCSPRCRTVCTHQSQIHTPSPVAGRDQRHRGWVLLPLRTRFAAAGPDDASGAACGRGPKRCRARQRVADGDRRGAV